MDVIVVNYRTPLDLEDFLRSYEEEKTVSKLWIVNNCPENKDRSLARHFQSENPWVSVINNEENIGYARAVNNAAALGNSETIAIFNADVVLYPGSLAMTANVLWSDPEFGIAGPKQVNMEGRLTHAGIFGTETDPKIRGWLQPDRGQYNEIRTDCYSIQGSAYFVKRHVWESLTMCSLYQEAAPGATGAFLPTPLFYEETFCSVHARHHGYKVVYDGHTTIMHKWHQSVKSNKVNVGRRMGEAQQMFRDACDVHGIIRQ